MGVGDGPEATRGVRASCAAGRGGGEEDERRWGGATGSGGSRSRSAGEGGEGDRGGMGCRLGFPPTGGVMGVRGWAGPGAGWLGQVGLAQFGQGGGGVPLLCFIFLFLIYFLFCFISF